MTKLGNICKKAPKQQQMGALLNRAGIQISRGRVFIFIGRGYMVTLYKREVCAIVWDVGKQCDIKLSNIKQQRALCLIGPEYVCKF